MGINWQEIWEKLKGDSTTLIMNIIVIVLVLIIASLAFKALERQTDRAVQKANKLHDKDKVKEIITLATTVRSVGRYIIYFLAILIILNQLGFGSSVNNILMTAGIGSLVISLGAQSIIRDFVSGLLLLFERQFSVGDYVTMGGFSGIVTSVGMRVTVLKSLDGQKIIIPNGSITSVANYGNESTPYIIPIAFPSTQKADRIIPLLNEGIDTCVSEHGDLFVTKPEVLGVTNLTAGRMEISIKGTSQAVKQAEAQREVRLAVKRVLDREGINM